MISGIGERVLIFRANAAGSQLASKKGILVLPRLRRGRTLGLAGGVRGDAKVTEVGIGPISVIARQMNMIRDDFIPEVFDTMQAEIRGLNHDARMLDLWKASLTESFDAGIDYLNRGMPEHLPEAPAAALAYARAAAQRDVPLSALVRAHRIGHAKFLEAAMGFVSLLEPEQRVPTITHLVNRANHFIDLVADQLTVAYEQEHDRWVIRRGGLERKHGQGSPDRSAIGTTKLDRGRASAQPSRVGARRYTDDRAAGGRDGDARDAAGQFCGPGFRPRGAPVRIPSHLRGATTLCGVTCPNDGFRASGQGPETRLTV
jgi:hypothetical protein